MIESIMFREIRRDLVVKVEQKKERVQISKTEEIGETKF